MASSVPGPMKMNSCSCEAHDIMLEHLKFKSLSSEEEDYAFVAVQLNLTGIRIVDSVIQIGACSMNWVFEQYLLPHKRIPNRMKYFLNLKVQCDGNNIRELVKNNTNERIPTQSEYKGLLAFMEWLESHVAKKKGVILLHQDSTNIMPMLLVKRLIRYNLLARFSNTVKGFLNIGNIRDEVTGVRFRDLKLSHLAKLLTPVPIFPLRDASVRAEAIFGIIEELLYGNHNQVLQEIENGAVYPDGMKQLREMCSRIQSSLREDKVQNLVQTYGRTMRSVEMDLAHLMSILRRQQTFRAVFKGLFDFNAEVRKRAVLLRDKLVEHNIEFHQVRGYWLHFGRSGLQRLFAPITGVSSYDRFFLIQIFDCYFDYRKVPMEIQMRRARRLRWLEIERSRNVNRHARSYPY